MLLVAAKPLGLFGSIQMHNGLHAKTISDKSTETKEKALIKQMGPKNGLLWSHSLEQLTLGCLTEQTKW